MTLSAGLQLGVDANEEVTSTLQHGGCVCDELVLAAHRAVAPRLGEVDVHFVGDLVARLEQTAKECLVLNQIPRWQVEECTATVYLLRGLQAPRSQVT